MVSKGCSQGRQGSGTGQDGGDLWQCLFIQEAGSSRNLGGEQNQNQTKTKHPRFKDLFQVQNVHAEVRMCIYLGAGPQVTSYSLCLKKALSLAWNSSI